MTGKSRTGPKGSKKAAPADLPADKTVVEIRERLADGVAALVHQVQRLGDLASRTGLPTAIPPTLGADIYSLTVAHLDVATRVLGHSQTLADKLLDATERRFGCERKLKSKELDSAPAGSKIFRFTVSSGCHEGKVDVDLSGNAKGLITATAVRPSLEQNEETGVFVRVGANDLPPKAYYGDVSVSVGGHVVARQPFEISVCK
jgi:hypothetical protein